MIKAKLKVVLDTNIFLSAIIFGGNPDRIINLGRASIIEIIVSPAIFLEISKKLHEKFYWNNEKISFTLDATNRFCRLVLPNENEKIKSRLKDKDDEKILRAAKIGSADFIVTGDKHLLVLKRFGKTKIVTPSQFLDVIYKNKLL